MAAIFDGSTPASACRSDMHQGWGLVKQLAPVVLLLPSLFWNGAPLKPERRPSLMAGDSIQVLCHVILG